MNTSKIKEASFLRLAGIVSGLLLMLPTIYPSFVFLQLVAFIPIFYVGAKKSSKLTSLAIAGLYMGLTYTLPQMVILKLPMIVTLILLVYLTLVMIVMSCICGFLLKRGNPIFASFAVASFLVVMEFVNISIIPIWGTAQSIMRPWSYYPELIQFTSLVGIVGVIFVVGSLQALIVAAIIKVKNLRSLAIAAMCVVAVVFGLNVLVQQKQPVQELTVAAVGWSSGDFPSADYPQTSQGFVELFAKPVADAASQGAKVLVSPEMGFCFSEYDKPEWINRFRSLAIEYDIMLMVGYFDATNEKNQMMFISPSDEFVPEYSKTYLVPYESCQKGNGELKTIEFDGIKVGGMICQDDNFTQFSREYGREKVSLIAVPTLDWESVKETHLQNSIHRAIESRYAIIRGTLNGISAIISPSGKVLSSHDHLVDGAAFITAKVPLYKYASLFSVAGYWFAAVCGFFVVVFIWLTKQPKPKRDGCSE